MGSDRASETAEDRFGRRVRTEREGQGWTQADLAKRLAEQGLNLHPSAIAKIELRDVDRPRAIRLDEAEAIAKVFGLDVDEMFETAVRRARFIRIGMSAWLRRVAGELEEGNYLLAEIHNLLAETDDKTERARLRQALIEEQFERAVVSTEIAVTKALSTLRHPSRTGALSWGHEDDPDASDT